MYENQSYTCNVYTSDLTKECSNLFSAVKYVNVTVAMVLLPLPSSPFLFSSIISFFVCSLYLLFYGLYALFALFTYLRYSLDAVYSLVFAVIRIIRFIFAFIHFIRFDLFLSIFIITKKTPSDTTGTGIVVHFIRFIHFIRFNCFIRFYLLIHKLINK
jgi:hypothetical protein